MYIKSNSIQKIYYSLRLLCCYDIYKACLSLYLLNLYLKLRQRQISRVILSRRFKIYQENKRIIRFSGILSVSYLKRFELEHKKIYLFQLITLYSLNINKLMKKLFKIRPGTRVKNIFFDKSSRLHVSNSINKIDFKIIIIRYII